LLFIVFFSKIPTMSEIRHHSHKSLTSYMPKFCIYAFCSSFIIYVGAVQNQEFDNQETTIELHFKLTQFPRHTRSSGHHGEIDRIIQFVKLVYRNLNALVSTQLHDTVAFKQRYVVCIISIFISIDFLVQRRSMTDEIDYQTNFRKQLMTITFWL
jgi:hypothetical protein